MKMIKAPIVKRLNAKIGISAFFTILFVLTLSVIQHQATFATLAGFDPGNIMEDIVMSKKNSMTQAQVQTFLKNKNSCNDTNLGRLTGYNSTDKNKATQGWIKTGGKTFYYNLKNGHFVCMADQSFNGESAAHIIWQAGQDYNVNPQVLITLLEKEQGLVTDTWPNTNYQYAAATGYDCPDTGSGCNNENSGFKTQVRKAAGLFHEVLSGGWSNYPVGNNYIQYNPSASCGGSTVNIRNRATSALYRYTPYQPNKAALNAGWGEAPCGAYGNRNFYNLFTTWFGSTRGTIDIKGINVEQQPFTDATTTVSFTITNNTKKTALFPSLGVAVRDPNNLNLDFPKVSNISLTPGQSYTYKQSRVLSGAEGAYSFFIARYDGTSWHYPPFNDYGQISNGGVTRTLTKKPTLTQPLSINSSSGSSIHANQAVTATFTVKNNSSLSLNIGRLKPAARDQNNTWLDFPDAKTTLAPGESYNYSAARTFPSKGRVHVWLTSLRNGYSWDDSFPAGSPSTTIRDRTITVLDDATLTSPLQLSYANAHATNVVSANFTVKNFGTKSVEIGYIKPSVRNEKNQNFDLPYSPYVTLAPGQSYTYTGSRELLKGTYHFWIANKRNGLTWSETFPSSETGSIVRSTNLTFNDSATVTEPLKISMSNPTAGSSATATFKVKNFGTKAITIGYIKPAVRDAGNKNYDFPYSPYIVLQPGEEYSYNHSRVLPTATTYKIWIANKRNGLAWSETFPSSETGSIVRKLSLNLQKTTRLTTPLSTSVTGNNVSATFTVKNFGTKAITIGYIKPAVRDMSNLVFDLPYSPYITLSAGQSYTYSGTRTLPSGKYHFWIANKRNGYSWSETFPVSQDSSLPRSTILVIP